MIKSIDNRKFIQIAKSYNEIIVVAMSIGAFYTYEYNGRRYTGCNNWDMGRRARGVVKPGEMTEIYINPDCLPDDLYDSIADMSQKAALNTVYLLLILTVFFGVLPLLFRIFLK